MCYTIVLTGETSDEKRMIGYVFFVNSADVFSCMIFSLDIRAVTKVLNIALMSPLCFRAGFPLGKPYGLPSCSKPVKAKSKSTYAGKEFANVFFHIVLELCKMEIL